MKVAAIGDNCIDLYEKLDRFYATGNAVDFAVNMQKLGIDTAVISTTGNDEYGTLMRKTLEEQGIDLSHFQVAEGKTAISYMDLKGLDRIYLDYVTQMALSWILKDDWVTSVIIGASSEEQLAANLAVIESPAFSEEELSRIDEILASYVVSSARWAVLTREIR